MLEPETATTVRAGITGPTPTSQEAMYSLTGGDEDAIAKTYKASLSQLRERDQSAFLRALLFIRFRRQGLPDARQTAALMSLSDVMDSFDDTRRIRAAEVAQSARQLARLEEDVDDAGDDLEAGEDSAGE
jgi:thioredoxin-like negative regulator of GroEL